MHQDNRNDKGIRRDSGRTVPTERQNAYRTANKAPSRIPVKSDGTIAPAVKRPASVNTRKYVRPAVCHGPAILVCIVMVLFIIAQFLLKTEAFTQQNPYIALVVVQFIVFILPCAFISAFGNRKMNGGLSQYNFRLFSPKLLGFIFSSLAVMLFGNMVIKYLGYMLFGAVGSSTVIYEHDNIFALIAATVLVPAVVFDKEGYRIGYGKGFYDRFLSNFTGVKVGLVYSNMILPKVPRGRFDKHVDIIISERGVVAVNAPR